VAAYEALRSSIMQGRPRAEGAAALRYHGMLHGLALLMRTSRASPAASRRPSHVIAASDEFVRLVANIVLRTHSELTHVY
jgi:hypothetical protein